MSRLLVFVCAALLLAVVFCAVLTNAAPPGECPAMEYKAEVARAGANTRSGLPHRIVFTALPPTDNAHTNIEFVDAHFSVNGGAQLNERMDRFWQQQPYRWSLPVSMQPGDTAGVTFTYNYNGVSCDTPPHQFVLPAQIEESEASDAVGAAPAAAAAAAAASGHDGECPQIEYAASVASPIYQGFHVAGVPKPEQVTHILFHPAPLATAVPSAFNPAVPVHRDDRSVAGAAVAVAAEPTLEWVDAHMSVNEGAPATTRMQYAALPLAEGSDTFGFEVERQWQAPLPAGLVSGNRLGLAFTYRTNGHTCTTERQTFTMK